MSTEANYLFVYGTLRVNESNHHLLASSEKVAMQAWTFGRLYDTGDGYPGLLPDKKRRVYGEVYKVTARELSKVDELEDYVPDRGINLYNRVKKKIYTDRGEVEAYLYVYLSKKKMKEYIPSGDWKLHRLSKRDSQLYFAYGSCMDNQRFRQAGVEKYFTDVLGCGVLRGYQLIYTKLAKSGGRANIIEAERKDMVQGKVYRLEKAALPYLYKREGVYTSRYRPAYIDVEINGKKIQDVLTFIVIHRKKETAPPYTYAEEIIRGGFGTVSDNYLLEHIHYLKTKYNLDMDELKKKLFKG